MRAKSLAYTIILFYALLASIPVFAIDSTFPPDFSLTDVKTGRLVRLYNFSNKVILLNFMTTWCPWDAKEFDLVLVPLYENYYKNDANVVFISIHLDPDKGPEINSYIKEHNINWIVLEGGKWSESQVASDYGVDAVPRTFILKFLGNVKEVVYQKRGHNQENLNKFYEVIEGAKKEILTKSELNNTQAQKQTPAVNNFEYLTQLPNGNHVKLNYSTTSNVLKSIAHDIANNRLYLKVRENNEQGFSNIFLPEELLDGYYSSIKEVVIVVDGKDAYDAHIENKGGGCLIRIEYDQGEHDIEVFYRSISLTVKVQSLFGLPVSNALVVLEWPNGKTYKELTVTSSGKAKFEKIPIISENYTIYVKHGILSFQYMPIEAPADKNKEITFVSYIYYDTLLIITVFSIISIVVLKHKRRRRAEQIGDNSTATLKENEESENNVRL